MQKSRIDSKVSNPNSLAAASAVREWLDANDYQMLVDAAGHRWKLNLEINEVINAERKLSYELRIAYECVLNLEGPQMQRMWAHPDELRLIAICFKRQIQVKLRIAERHFIKRSDIKLWWMERAPQWRQQIKGQSFLELKKKALIEEVDRSAFDLR